MSLAGRIRKFGGFAITDMSGRLPLGAETEVTAVRSVPEKGERVESNHFCHAFSNFFVGVGVRKHEICGTTGRMCRLDECA